MARRPDHHVIVVCGPAGCGKTTVAKQLAADLGYVYLEGDEFHTPAAIEKMSRSEPLTDGDRWDWLVRLRERAAQLVVPEGLPEGPPEGPPEDSVAAAGVVVSCSSLKKKYRDVLRVLAVGAHRGRVDLRFILLHVPVDQLVQRVQARAGHYMKASMVRSQLESLELPTADENGTDTVTVDAGGDPAAVYRAARAAVAPESREQRAESSEAREPPFARRTPEAAGWS